MWLPEGRAIGRGFTASAARPAFALGAGAAFLLGCLLATSATADVKVRSYDRGSKTEKELRGRSGTGTAGGLLRRGKRGSAARPHPQDDFEPGEVLIANPPRGFEAKMGALGISVMEKVSLGAIDYRFYRLKTPRKMPVRKAMALIKDNLPGALVDANHRFDLSAKRAARGSFPLRAAGWQKVGAQCGKGVRIGLIDSAVDVSHPVLKGQKIQYKSFHDIRRNPAPSSHGTTMAAMLIGRPLSSGWSGLLPGASLYAASMFEINRRDEVVGTSVGLVKALNWMAENKVKIVNLSIAGGDNNMVREAAAQARRNGMVLVASVGNWGFAQGAAYPAGYEEVIAVTAVSNRRKIYRDANKGPYVDFAAPGVRIWAPTMPGVKPQSGTSLATPYVTVLAALEVAKGTRADPSALRVALRRGAIDLGRRGKDDVFGWGLVASQPTCMP